MRELFGTSAAVRRVLIPTRLPLTWIQWLTLATLIWLGAGSRWSGTTILMWNRVVPSYPVGLTESETAGVMLRETLSFLLLPFLLLFLTRIATPLARSFSTSQTLWLRLSPVRPVEMFLARGLASAQFVAVWLSSAGAVTALIAFKHGLGWSDALVALLGPSALFVFGTGWILAAGRFFKSSVGEPHVSALAGVVVPLILYVFRNTLVQGRTALWTQWYPEYLPFVDDVTLRNVLGLAALGIVLSLSAYQLDLDLKGT